MRYDSSPEFNQEENGSSSGGEIMVPPKDAGSVLTQITRGEIGVQMDMAQAYPRSLQKFRATSIDLVTQTPEIADDCIYALPRAGKNIEGPSIRFAEIVAQAWRNNRSGARPVAEDNDFVTVQGFFQDFETNMAVVYEVKRRITDSKGRRYSADMIGTTTNAANAIARRNAILGGIPRPYWEEAYQACRKVIAGDIKTLGARRDAALKAFALHNVKPAQLFAMLKVEGINDINSDHLVTLRGVLTAIKDGSATVESIFAKGDEVLAAKSATGLKEIKERYSNPPAAAPAVAAESERVAAPAEEPPAGKATDAVQVGAVAEPAPAPVVEVEPDPEELWSRCAKHGDYQGLECPACAAEVAHQEEVQVEPLFEKKTSARHAPRKE